MNLVAPRTGKSGLSTAGFPGLYLPVFLCFLVICLSNTTLLAFLSRYGLLYNTMLNAYVHIPLAERLARTSLYFINPLKSFIFFVCTAFLMVPLGKDFYTHFLRRISRADLRQTALAFVMCLSLTATLRAASFGRAYSRLSVDPFNQETTQLSRRFLLQGLAYLYHVDGFLYVVFCWVIVFAAALTVKLYLRTKGIESSFLVETSLLTVGIFISAFQFPGYPESVVFLLGMVALMEFERDSRLTSKQLVAFSLALMAHEACAVITFVPMFLFIFGRRSWIPASVLVVLYALAVEANYSFDLMRPFRDQASAMGVRAQDYFLRAPWNVVLGGAFSFKLLWLLVPVGLFYGWKTHPGLVGFVLSGVGFAFAATYIGIDYTRIVGFATIPVLVCFVYAAKRLPRRVMQIVLVLNFMAPSLYVGGATNGPAAFRGLYWLAYRTILHLPPPGV